MTFVVRAGAGAASLAPSATAAIREIDPSQPVADVIPMDAVVARTTARPLLSAVLGSRNRDRSSSS
jgi:hypothetical protein